MMEPLKVSVIVATQILVFSIIPDAAPGPHDGVHLFDEFLEMIDAWKEQN